MEQLLGMGFSKDAVQSALADANNDPHAALELLIGPPLSDSEISAPNSPRSLCNSASVRVSPRTMGEPGIITSHTNPEIGALLSILLSNYWTQKLLATCNIQLMWSPDWASAQPQIPPQTLEAELTKQCAFVHMGAGRAHADAALVEQAMMVSPESLEEFLKALVPLAPAFGIQLDGEYVPHLRAENVNGELTAHLDQMLLGKSMGNPPPLVLVEVGQASKLRVEKSWFPQRCTAELEPLTAAARNKRHAIEERLSEIRRERMDLRVYRGTDVIDMLSVARGTLRQYDSLATVKDVDTLEANIGARRNELMDQLEELENERIRLDSMLKTLNPALAAEVGVQPVPIYRYGVSGVLISASEYYMLYDGIWFYVRNDRPSACAWLTVREACYDQTEIMVVYSRLPDFNELQPSEAIQEFCRLETQALALESDTSSVDSMLEQHLYYGIQGSQVPQAPTAPTRAPSLYAQPLAAPQFADPAAAPGVPPNVPPRR